MSRLIPRATPLEGALEDAIATRLALPAHLAGVANDPWNCPAEHLGFLAWSLSLELWDDAWPELKRRQVCARALELHRLKTTLAGVRAHLGLVDVSIDRVTRPPSRFVLAAPMSAAQRAAWIDGLPQVRLYPFLKTAVMVRRPAFSGPAGICFLHGFLRANRGLELANTRATLFDRGEERDIRYVPPAGDGVVQLLIPRTARRSWHGSGFLTRQWLTPSAAGAGVVTLRLSADIGGFAVAAGLQPVDVRPDRVAQPRVAPAARGFLCRGAFLLATHAPWQIYDRVALHAPDRLAPRRRARSYLGRDRLGMAPFSAELRLAIPLRRPRARRFAWHRSGFLQAADMRPLDRAIEAIGVAKAARDTILVDTALHRQVSFGDGRRFGTFAFGQLGKVA